MQVKRLSDLMSEVIPIHGRGNFPTLEVRLCDLIRVVRARLEEDGVKVSKGSKCTRIPLRFIWRGELRNMIKSFAH